MTLEEQINGRLKEEAIDGIRPFEDMEEAVMDIMDVLDPFGLTFKDDFDPKGDAGQVDAPLVWFLKPEPEDKKAMPKPVLHVEWRKADDGYLVQALIKEPQKEVKT